MADLIPMLAAVAGQAGEEADEDFNQTVLLLHGDGTNGAQNNTFLDGSSNNFTITRNGNTTQGTFSPFSVGAGEWSNYFDGTGDYLSAAASSNLNVGSGDFTIEGLFYTSAPSASAGIVTAWNNNQYLIQLSSSKLNFAWAPQSTAGFIITGTTTILANVWYHFALVRNGNTFTLYLNGVSEGSSTSSATTANMTTPLLVGAATVDNSVQRFFTGYISNVRVVKGTAVYTSGFTPPTAPLTAISGTELLTCQSNRFIDNSTNAFAITRNGDVRVTPFSPFAPSAAYSASTNGGSGYFDGTGDHLTTPSNAALGMGTGDFTIECFYYHISRASTDGILCPFTGNLNITILTTGVLGYFDGANFHSSTQTVPLNAWGHICLNRTGSTVKMYYNGTEVLSRTDTTNFASTYWFIGTNSVSDTDPAHGYISNVRIVKGTAITPPAGGPTSLVTAVSGTELLLNFTNAGIFDNTGKNNLETVGNAQIDTGTKKYGTGSMEFDGTGDWLLMAHNPDQQLGTGNFTIEFWVYLASGDTGSARGLVAKGTSNTGWLVSLDSSEKVVFTYTSSTITSSGAITTNAWNHIAVVREGTGSNQTKIYIGGTNDGTGTVSTDFNQTSVMYVGCNRTAGDPMKGFIDDLRVTKGVARYTANFSVPGKAFPDL